MIKRLLSTHVHNGSTLIYPISHEMHVKEDAGEYLHISSFHTLLSPVIYHITINIKDISCIVVFC